MHSQLTSAVRAGWVSLRRNYSYQIGLNELEQAATKSNTTILSLIIRRSSNNFLSFLQHHSQCCFYELMLRNPLNHPFGKSSIEVLHLLFCFSFTFDGGMQLTAVGQRKKRKGKKPPTKQNKNIQPPKTE